jgi:hypothetical protein
MLGVNAATQPAGEHHQAGAYEEQHAEGDDACYYGAGERKSDASGGRAACDCSADRERDARLVVRGCARGRDRVDSVTPVGNLTKTLKLPLALLTAGVRVNGRLCNTLSTFSFLPKPEPLRVKRDPAAGVWSLTEVVF